MNLRDAGMAKLAAGPQFEVTLRITVEDMLALWSAAADAAIAVPGMTLSDVIDTIGPREDPALAECLAMLAGPSSIAGCALESFEVTEVRAPAGATILALPRLRAAAH